MRRAGILIAFIITSLAFAVEMRAQKSAEASEDVVKAGYIYNFAKFVEWPAGTFPSAESPIVIGVLGDDSFANVLVGIVDGKKIDGHKLVVKKLKWSRDFKDVKDCNMLFIASSEMSHGDELIQMMKNTSTLSIGDNFDFARRGGIINFILVDSNVRFEVNVDTAKQAELNISSRLLSIAKIVKK